MNIEINVSTALAKAEALRSLRHRGYDAATGPVRLAFPFAILVGDVRGEAADEVLAEVRRIDPDAGLVATTTAAPWATP